jgi:ATP-dependent DNA helicase RecG
MHMSDITNLLITPEGRTLEFKRDLSSLGPVLRTLVALANTSGGVMVIGVEDGGAVCGVKDAKTDEERLANAVADGIAPLLMPDIETVQFEGKDLLVVRIAHFPGPFHLASSGPDEGVYIRLGSTNRRAPPEKVEELRRLARQRAFDRQPCLACSIDDLDLDAVEKAFSRVSREIDEAKLESLDVLVRHGGRLTPSNGGMILFGKEAARRGLFPGAQVRCARFLGTDKVDFLDRLDIEGTVLQAVAEVPKFVRRNTRMAARIESMLRQDIPEYPLVALREGLVNAVAHTDYSLQGMDIKVAVYADRLEVENPGTLPFGMTVVDIRAGISKIRNPVIARVMRELDLMETWGTGFKRMREDCEEGGYPVPDWVELSSVIRTVFRPHPEVAALPRPGLAGDVGANDGVNDGANVGAAPDLNERQRWFLSHVEAEVRIHPLDIAQRFGITTRTAERDVAALSAAGLVEFVGPTKTGRYVRKKAEG